MKNNTKYSPLIFASLCFSAIPLLINRFITELPDWIAYVSISIAIILYIAHVVIARRRCKIEK